MSLLEKAATYTCELGTYLDVIPHSTIISLDRYIDHGIIPGGFLTAVLHNNLRDAVVRADQYNLQALLYIVRLIHNEAPSSCWGSKEAVDRWINSKRDYDG